jgi:hypothetical protein
MQKNTARMPGEPGPQPREGISNRAMSRILLLEADSGKFEHLEHAQERLHGLLDAMQAGLVADMGVAL